MQHCGGSDRGRSVAESHDRQLPGPATDDAFEQFVRGRSAHLFRLALVLTGWDQAAAEDVLQIALERAYRRRRQLFRHGSAEPMSARWWSTPRSTGGGFGDAGRRSRLTWPRTWLQRT